MMQSVAPVARGVNAFYAKKRSAAASDESKALTHGKNKRTRQCAPAVPARNDSRPGREEWPNGGKVAEATEQEQGTADAPSLVPLVCEHVVRSQPHVTASYERVNATFA